MEKASNTRSPTLSRRRVAENQLVALRLDEAADLLEQQEANPFRVRAFRRAAESIRHLDRGIDAIAAEGGAQAIEAIPEIGPSITRSIVEILSTDHWRFLETLRGAIEPQRLFVAVPGIGPAMSRRIHDELGCRTLEELEVAANNGRLESLSGLGRRRAAAIRAALDSMLRRVRPRRDPLPLSEPEVDLFLDVDTEYRRKVEAGRLRKIAPRRFNPSGEPWLPILHTRRNDWHFTALFSNTARAHELGKIKDWVVIYFNTDHGFEGQRTVVTETHGPLVGKRVVRGREDECYRASQNGPASSGVESNT